MIYCFTFNNEKLIKKGLPFLYERPEPQEVQIGEEKMWVMRQIAGRVLLQTQFLPCPDFLQKANLH